MFKIPGTDVLASGANYNNDELQARYPSSEGGLSEPPEFPSVGASTNGAPVEDAPLPIDLATLIAEAGTGNMADFNATSSTYNFALVSRETFDKGTSYNKLQVNGIENAPVLTLGNISSPYLVLTNKVAEAVCANMRILDGKEGFFRLPADPQGVPLLGVFRGQTASPQPITNIIDAANIKAHEGSDPSVVDFMPSMGQYRLTVVDDGAAQHACKNANIQVRDWHLFPTLDVKGKRYVAIPRRLADAMRTPTVVAGELMLPATRSGRLRPPFISNPAGSLALSKGAATKELQSAEAVRLWTYARYPVFAILVLMLIGAAYKFFKYVRGH